MRLVGRDLDVWLPLTVVFLCRTVICGEPPRILGDRQITYRAKVGENIKLKCRATGGKESPPTWTLFYWAKNNGDVIRRGSPNWSRFSIKQNKYLRIKNVQPQDAGEYLCTARNEFGFDNAKRLLVVTNTGKVRPVKPSRATQKTRPTKVRVRATIPTLPNFLQDENQPPIILRRLDSNNYKEFPTGTNARLKCIVTGLPTPTISWTKNGHHIQQTDRIRVGTGNTVLLFKFLTKKDSGKYTCTAVNKHGQANYTYIVNVTKQMKFMDPGINFKNLTAVYSKNVTLFCETDLRNKRGGLPKIQWFRWLSESPYYLSLTGPSKGSSDLKGNPNRYKETYSNKNGTVCLGLTVINVTWEDAGRYRCMIGSGRSTYAIKDVRLDVKLKVGINKAHVSRISSKLQIPLFIVITIPVVAGIICIIVVLACWRVHRKKIQETKRRSRESVKDAKENEPLQNGHITSLEKGLNHVPNGHVVRPIPNGTLINHISNGKVPNGIKLTVVHHHNPSNGVTTKCIDSNGILPLCHESETENETET